MGCFIGLIQVEDDCVHLVDGVWMPLAKMSSPRQAMAAAQVTLTSLS